MQILRSTSLPSRCLCFGLFSPAQRLGTRAITGKPPDPSISDDTDDKALVRKIPVRTDYWKVGVNDSAGETANLKPRDLPASDDAKDHGPVKKFWVTSPFLRPVGSSESNGEKAEGESSNTQKPGDADDRGPVERRSVKSDSIKEAGLTKSTGKKARKRNGPPKEIHATKSAVDRAGKREQFLAESDGGEEARLVRKYKEGGIEALMREVSGRSPSTPSNTPTSAPHDAGETVPAENHQERLEERPRGRKVLTPNGNDRSAYSLEPPLEESLIRGNSTSTDDGLHSEIFNELFSAEILEDKQSNAANTPKPKRYVSRVPVDIEPIARRQNDADFDVDKWLDSKGGEVDKQSLRAALQMRSKQPGLNMERRTDISDEERELHPDARHADVANTGTPFPTRTTGLDETMGTGESLEISAHDSFGKLLIEEDEVNETNGLEGRNYGLLVLSGASRLLTEADFRHLDLALNRKHIEKWNEEKSLVKVIRGRDKSNFERNGDYFLLFDSNSSAKRYHNNAHKVAYMARHRFKRTQNIFIPPVPSSEYQPGTLGSLVDGYALSAPGEPLRLDFKEPPWPPLIQSLVEHWGYAELKQYRQSEHDVLFAVEGALLRSSDIHKCLVTELSRRRGSPWGFVEPLKVVSFDLNSPYAAKAANVGEDSARRRSRGSRSKDFEYLRRRFLIPFKSAEAAERFVLAWHRREIDDLSELLEGFARTSVTVTAELTW